MARKRPVFSFTAQDVGDSILLLFSEDAPHTASNGFLDNSGLLYEAFANGVFHDQMLDVLRLLRDKFPDCTVRVDFEGMDD